MASPPPQATYYDILGISSDATPSQIRAAWRVVAVALHPDRSGDDVAGDDFIAAREAYETLSSPQRRRVYDAQLRTNSSSPRPSTVYTQPPASPPPPPPPPQYTRPHSEQRHGYRGADLRTSIVVDFAAAVFGTHAEAIGQRRALCRSCGGYPPPPSGCIVCGLTGYESLSFVADVDVPPGTTNGALVTVANYGDVGDRPILAGEPYGVPGPPGDLLVRVDVRPQPGVISLGQDLIYDLPVDVIDALLGIRQRINLLDGPATVVVPPGTAPGQRLRIVGRGVPHPAATRGDAMVEVRIVMRDDLTEPERALLETLRRPVTRK